MYGSTPLSTIMGALPAAPTDYDGATAYAKAMARHGLPVLLVHPDSKVPADWRSTAEKKKDPETKGVHLATTKATTLTKYLKRAYAAPEDVKRGHPGPLPEGQTMNWAVKLRGSGYVVADADTPGEVAALEAFLAPSYGGRAPSPTVVTPGTTDGAHHGGGHWWFRLPEDLAETMSTAVGLPASTKITVPGHDESFVLYMGDAYVLVPPSVRDGKPYRLVSPDNDLPDVLAREIQDRLDLAESRAEQRRERLAELEDAGEPSPDDLGAQITAWAMSMPWADILTPHGWVDTGLPDSCGCRVWTAPGPHGSSKSATTHSDVCTDGRYDLHNAPMHVWTDNPGDAIAEAVATYQSKTLSKLRVYAALNHGGDEGAAMAELGIQVQQGTPLDMAAAVAGAGGSQDAASVSGAAPASSVSLELVTTEPVKPDVDPDTGAAPYDSVVDGDGDVPTTVWGGDIYESLGVKRPEAGDNQFRAFRVAPASAFSDLEPPQWLVQDLLEHGLCSIVGDSGVGKSAITLDILCHMAMGWPWRGKETRQCSSLYLAGESIHGALDRLQTWARVHEAPEVLDRVVLMQGTPQVSGDAVYLGKIEETVLRYDLDVIVVDTLARATVGLEENAAKDMGVVNGVFDRLMRDTGASLWYVHHLTRGTSHGRGSTALYGAVDSEVLITDLASDGDVWDTKGDHAVAYRSDNTPMVLDGKPLTVKVNKQKNGPDTGDETWVQVLLSSTESPDDDRRHMIVTELDGMARHLFAGGEALTDRKRDRAVERPTADMERMESPAVTQDHEVVKYLAELTREFISQSTDDTVRWTQAGLSRATSFMQAKAELARQGWNYSWPEHVKAGMDLAVSLYPEVGRPTGSTIGYVDPYAEQG